MGEVLVFLAVAALVIFVLLAGAAFFVAWKLRNRNRVSPDAPTLAPMSWLMLPTPFARLHRRLRNTVVVARTAASTSTAGADLAATIEAQAIALDHHIVVTARLRSGRYEGLRALTAQVSQLETLAGRLAHATIDAQRRRALPQSEPDPLAEIAARLDALDAARSDLTRIERAAGLG